MANRNIICTDCGNTKWISQKLWRGLLVEFGTSGCIKRNFRCKSCKKLEKDDFYKYNMLYGKNVKKLRTELKKIHWEYLTHKNINKLQTDFNDSFKKHNVDPTKVQYVTTPNTEFVLDVIIKEVPFINMIPISIYTIREKTN